MSSTQPKRPAESTRESSNSAAKKPKKAPHDSDAPSTKPAAPTQHELQKSLLESDVELRRVFLQFLKEKPESIERKQFVRDFWADRQHLLRAHAVEREQSRGRYNVLSEVKPTVREGSMKIDFTQEQMAELFRMYPVVRRAHTELLGTPGGFSSEVAFWQEFFRSRLCKRLRGLRVTEEDARSPLLDRYLDAGESEVRERLGRQLEAGKVPHYMDLEGNEANTKWVGNKPDETMRQKGDVEMPVIRRLNATSERILSGAEAPDGEAHGPVGMDEDTWREVRLRDLQGEEGGEGMRLNIQNQSALQVERRTSEKKVTAKGKGGSKTALQSVRKSTEIHQDGALDLAKSIGFEDDEDSGSEESDSEDERKKRVKKPRTSSDRSLRLATHQIQSLIRAHHDDAFINLDSGRQSGKHDTETVMKAFGWPADSEGAITELILTHQTTNEILHYVWSLMLAQSPTMAQELPSLMGGLETSVQRLKSQAEAAETVRKGKLQELKKQAQQIAQRTRRDPGIDTKKAGPSRKQIESLVGPLTKAVGVAVAKGKQMMKSVPVSA